MEVFLANLISEQRKQGIDAHAIVHGSPEIDDPPWIHRVPVEFHVGYAPMALGFRGVFRRAIRQLQPDILHLHMPNNSALWALTLPAARKVPWVIHWHSDVVVSSLKWSVAIGYLLYRPFEQALLERAQQIFVTSPPYLQASGALRPWREKCEVVPLGIDLAPPPSKSPPITAPFWNPSTSFRVLSIGRLTYYKGFETLIQAVTGMPGVELLIAGAGELKDSLQLLIEQITPPQTPPAVRLLGAIDEPLKHLLFQQADLFCLASNERTEAFGLVLLEAMQHSRPCLVTDLPGSGMPWVVAQARCGLLVPEGDISAWRSAIARLQHDRDLRTQLGQSGYHALHDHFSIGPCERIAARHYQGLAPDRRPIKEMKDLLIVISTENNADSIGSLIDCARNLTNAPVLVIDNRSTDATCAIAAQRGARVLRPVLRMSAWGGLQTGMRHGLVSGYNYVVTITAGEKLEEEELLTLLRERTKADLVIGIRKSDEHQITPKKARWRPWIFDHATSQPSAFRLYNRVGMEVMTSTAAILLDYEDIGTLILARQQNLRVCEVNLPSHQHAKERAKTSRNWTKEIRRTAASLLLSISQGKFRTKLPKAP